MRMLVVGAGALGGYYGGRLAAAGRDVTFLVRPKRARQLAERGLAIVSMHGDAHIAAPRTVQAGAVDRHYDFVFVATKSYGLAQAVEDMAPAVGGSTTILPILNGMQHIETLTSRFGAERVLGGTALIVATLGPEGEVRQVIPHELLSFGELGSGSSQRVEDLLAFMQGAVFNPKASGTITHDMWEKWAGLATNAAITCLMRGTIGDVLNAPGGRDTILAVLDECRTVASAAGFALRPPFVDFIVKLLTTEGSPLTASMLRDIEAGAPTEADHIHGDFIARAEALDVPTPLLRIAYCHLGTYSARRAREAAQV